MAENKPIQLPQLLINQILFTVYSKCDTETINEQNKSITPCRNQSTSKWTKRQPKVFFVLVKRNSGRSEIGERIFFPQAFSARVRFFARKLKIDRTLKLPVQMKDGMCALDMTNTKSFVFGAWAYFPVQTFQELHQMNMQPHTHTHSSAISHRIQNKSNKNVLNINSAPFSSGTCFEVIWWHSKNTSNNNGRRQRSYEIKKTNVYALSQPKWFRVQVICIRSNDTQRSVKTFRNEEV